MGTEPLRRLAGTAIVTPMSRLALLVLPLALAACGATQVPVQSASASPQMFRGGQSEVRLRCGSETLRAKLRQGQLLVQVGNGENSVLVPVDDPRAQAGHAYGDGKLTLFKVRDPEGWRLARADTADVAECRREYRAN